jgi:general secretion pathway protein L
MQIGFGVVFRWFAVLAAIVEDFAQWRRTRKSVLIRKQGDAFVIEKVSKTGASTIAQVPLDSVLPANIAQSLHKHAIDFELADSEVVARSLTVPSQAKDVLPGIVRNQIERLSPWPLSKTVYGFEAMKSETNAQNVDVSILMSSQKTIEGLRDQLAASNLAPNRFIARRDPAEREALALWTRASAKEGEANANLPRLIAAAVAVFVLLSAGATVWALIDASTIWTERDDIAERAHSLRQNSASSGTLSPASAGSQSERAWAMKENTPAAVMILNALSSALPDSAYLTELSLERAVVKITGLSNDPPPLINALQQSGQFTGAHFVAATTKDPEKGGYRFSIEAQAAPQNKSAGD